MSLSGRTIVITGSTRGIGRAAALACAGRGATVVISSRDAEKTAATVAEIVSAGGRALGLAADVADYAAVERLRDLALAQTGRLDGWFSNAGISLGYEPVDEQSPEELARIVSINLTGHLFCARAVLPHFREHGGHLLNMCGRGYRGDATPHTAAYAATKAAIASLTLSLAEENRDRSNVSVNGFVRGMVATDFYVDIRTSPRLAATADNWRFALDAFGVPLDEAGAGAADALSIEPGSRTGHIYSMLGPKKMIPGIAKMTWWGMSGRMKRA